MDILELAVKYGASGVYLFGVWVLWRANVDASKKYEALLERVVTQLTLLNKELGDRHDAE
jgi:hypothetical protein